MAGGVKPLHHNPNSVKTTKSGPYQTTFTSSVKAEPIPDDLESLEEEGIKVEHTEVAGKRRKKNKQFDFPEGGWECK